MSGENLLSASRRGDVKEVNRLLSMEANIHHEDEVRKVYYSIVLYTL
jgi:hypothetical protein